MVTGFLHILLLTISVPHVPPIHPSNLHPLNPLLGNGIKVINDNPCLKGAYHLGWKEDELAEITGKGEKCDRRGKLRVPKELVRWGEAGDCPNHGKSTVISAVTLCSIELLNYRLSPIRPRHRKMHTLYSVTY